MIDGLFIASIVCSCVQAMKEAFEHKVPSENWANMELYYKDIRDGVPIEQRMRNLENGKYKKVDSYPKPHRDPVDDKIIIENSNLYYEDLKEHGAIQVQKWVKQGRYNLSPEELKKEEERIRKHYKYLYSL